jgi:hypothetical protein
VLLVFSRGVSAQCRHADVYSCGVESSVFATSVAPVYEFAILGDNSCVEGISVIYFTDGVETMKLSACVLYRGTVFV